MTVRAVLTRIDAMPGRAVLLIDLALALLVGLAHGGALALTYVEPSPEARFIRQLASMSLPLVAVLLVSTVVGLIWRRLARAALALHGVILALGSIAALLWALSLLIGGIPETNFSWSPGLMSVFIAYGIFVFSRHSVPVALRSRPVFFFAPLAVLALALPIDVAIFVRLIGAMAQLQGGFP